MDKLDELIKRAVEAMNSNYSFNEIELADGEIKIRLVRNTPAPWYNYPPPYQYQYQFRV